MKKFWGAAAMIAATLLWGGAFSAQSTGMRFLDPLPFTAIRSVIGMIALAVLIVILDLVRKRRPSFWGSADSSEAKKTLLAGGFWCGIVIAAASTCQQYGLKSTTAGKTGFLTALYIVIVPLLGILFHRRTTPVLWLAVALALAGSWLLCGGIGSIGRGELYVIICAVIYSVHILVIDRYAARCDCVRLSCLQFFVASILLTAASLIAGSPCGGAAVRDALPVLLFCGVGSSAVAFTLQMVSQKYLHPVAATLLMSLESVFAVLGGWIFLGEVLTLREFAGCCVIFAAVLLAQIPIPHKKTDAPAQAS